MNFPDGVTINIKFFSQSVTVQKQHIYFIFSSIFIFFSGNCKHYNEEQNNIIIDIWYGSNQTFGNPGNAQRQINVLGNIHTEIDVIAYYLLNDDTTKNFLALGSDLHRLAKKGDFNIEIDRRKLIEGANNIILQFTSKEGNHVEEKIIVNYMNDTQWQLPYSVDWAKVENIQDGVQVVDGHWELTPEGIRTKTMYYDRILAFGDSTWKNYEVSSVIFHDFILPKPGPPTYNVSHAAIASRWPGHDIDSLQPNRKWYPLGATSEFRLTSDYDSCRWRIFDGENFYAEQEPIDYRKIQPEVWYGLKHRVNNLKGDKTVYSVKFWELDKGEPETWDFMALEGSGNIKSGSACLIAHNTDVTFGNISVIPVDDKN